jgi:hypothetical protein
MRTEIPTPICASEAAESDNTMIPKNNHRTRFLLVISIALICVDPLDSIPIDDLCNQTILIPIKTRAPVLLRKPAPAAQLRSYDVNTGLLVMLRQPSDLE